MTSVTETKFPESSDTAQHGGIASGSVIYPDPSPREAPFWEGARNGKLMLQTCNDCGHQWHPIADVCSKCLSFSFTWMPASGRAVLYSFTVVHHAVHPVVAKWVPYTLCIAALEEGPHVVSAFAKGWQGEIEIGCDLQVEFLKVDDQLTLPLFRPIQKKKTPIFSKDSQT